MYQIINRMLNVPPQTPLPDVMQMAKDCASTEMARQDLLVDMLMEGKHTINGVEFDQYTVLVYLPTEPAHV
jgi:hypothetical protein